MLQGTIKNIVIGKGFGFIEPTGSGPDVFFHAKVLAPELPFDEQLPGRRVHYDTFTTDRGPRASHVRAAE